MTEAGAALDDLEADARIGTNSLRRTQEVANTLLEQGARELLEQAKL